VPERAIFSGELDAFETIASVPLTAPAEVGAKVTVNVTVWVGFSVAGKVRPLTEYPAPVTLACVIVTADPPVLVSVSERLELLPVWTLPKARLAGFAESWPSVMPVPERAIFSGELDAFDTIASVPLAAPAAVGVKVAVKVTLWVGFSVAGRVRPEIENPAPVTVACEMVTAVPPVLVRVSERFALLPT